MIILLIIILYLEGLSRCHLSLMRYIKTLEAEIITAVALTELFSLANCQLIPPVGYACLLIGGQKSGRRNSTERWKNHSGYDALHPEEFCRAKTQEKGEEGQDAAQISIRPSENSI